MATKTYELNIDRGDIGRELKGFGASSAWWSQDIDSKSMREKLAKYSVSNVVTVWGLGYKWQD